MIDSIISGVIGGIIGAILANIILWIIKRKRQRVQDVIEPITINHGADGQILVYGNDGVEWQDDKGQPVGPDPLTTLHNLHED